MTKKELAALVVERLKEEYPGAECTLDYNEAWKLLVSVRLAAQCTDARVNVVVKGLYEKYPDVNALAGAPVEEIEEIVKPCGLGHSKARDISACMKVLRTNTAERCRMILISCLSFPASGVRAQISLWEMFSESRPLLRTRTVSVW